MKYVIKSGKDIKILFIPNFWESLTIHPPQNKFIAKKCNQNKIIKDGNSKRLKISSKPK